jgi:hypothetical protein
MARPPAALPKRAETPRVVLALLAASLVVNAALVFRTRGSVKAPPAPAPANAHEEASPADPECARQLFACQQANGGLALGMGLWRAAAEEARTMPARAPGGAMGQTSGRSERGAALCAVAKDKLREQWNEKKDALTKLVTTDLLDTAKRHDNAEHDAAHAADVLALSGAARRAFERAFADAEDEGMAGLAPAAQAKPVHWAALLAGARGLFEGEDALVTQQLGEESAERYRASVTNQRVTILSILATYANADWDDAVVAP